jgi:thymidylate synthase (FAD)
MFFPPLDIPWRPDVPDFAFPQGPHLVEFAGRACYQSWKRPNPETATNAGYIRHILEVGHLSVLEHGTVSFYLTGVSRSLTHELVRHRHFSYSQLSQRYVPGAGDVVTPDVIAEDSELAEAFNVAVETAAEAYEKLKTGLERKFAHLDEGTAKKKAARQAARAVLPNATETKIVVTGNYRALRHFITMRASEHADVEIRALAIEMLRQLQARVANVFGDYEISTLPDGTEVASSLYGEIS